jgi:hypothetical protein
VLFQRLSGCTIGIALVEGELKVSRGEEQRFNKAIEDMCGASDA